VAIPRNFKKTTNVEKSLKLDSFRRFELFTIEKSRKAGLYSPQNAKQAARKLNFKTEARKYLRRILSQRGKSDLRTISYFSKQISPLLTSQTIGFIGIPAHYEERDLIRTLKCYETYGNLVHKKFVVVLLVNGFGSQKKRKEYERKKALILSDVSQSISRKLKIIILGHFGKKRKPIGGIRGLMLDAMILSSMKANLKDPILVSHDADMVALQKGYFHRIQKIFQKNPLLDLASGPTYTGYSPKLDQPSDFRWKLPELYISVKVHEAFNIINEKNDDQLIRRFAVIGSNMSLRLSALCACGGWGYQYKFAEDHALRIDCLGMRFHEKKGTGYPNKYFIFDKRLSAIVDPRRLLKSILQDKNPEFLDHYGSHLDTNNLAKLYLRSKKFIQCSDMRSVARKTRSRIRSYLTERLVFNLNNIDALDDKRIAHAFATHFGLYLKKYDFNSELGGAVELEIDWKKSRIESDLKRWCSKNPT
jgi:hypothetical protein